MKAPSEDLLKNQAKKDQEKTDNLPKSLSSTKEEEKKEVASTHSEQLRMRIQQAKEEESKRESTISSLAEEEEVKQSMPFSSSSRTTAESSSSSGTFLNSQQYQAQVLHAIPVEQHSKEQEQEYAKVVKKAQEMQGVEQSNHWTTEHLGQVDQGELQSADYDWIEMKHPSTWSIEQREKHMSSPAL